MTLDIKSDFYHLGVNSIARTTIYDALAHRPAAVYEDFFNSLVDGLNRHERRTFGRHFLVDSTTISLCVSQYDWAKYKATKGGIKMHTVYDAEGKSPAKVVVGNAREHDLKGIANVIHFEPGAFYVYDRAYACYAYLRKIHKNKAFFVTRIKSNWLYRVVEERGITCASEVVADQIIEVDGTRRKEYPDPLRLVTIRRREDNKALGFLTNNMEASAEEIAAIYKSRWQIELFFKWIKQHLKITSFFSTSNNGVLVQIWCALIAFLLLRLVQETLTIQIGLYALLRRIQDHLDKRTDLHAFLAPPPIRPKASADAQIGWLFS